MYCEGLLGTESYWTMLTGSSRPQGALGFIGVFPTSQYVFCGSGRGIKPCSSCGGVLHKHGVPGPRLRESSLGTMASHRCFLQMLSCWPHQARIFKMYLSSLQLSVKQLVLNWKSVTCPLRVGGKFLPQEEEFMHLTVLFSEGKAGTEWQKSTGSRSVAAQLWHGSIFILVAVISQAQSFLLPSARA